MSIIKIFTTRGVILLALTAMVVLSIISYRSIVKLNKLGEMVDHTHVVQLHLQRTYSALSDAGSELKSFLITKDSSYYNNLMDERRVVLRSIDRLIYLTQDNPPQQKRVYSLDSLIQARWIFIEGSMRATEDRYDYYSAKIENCNRLLKNTIDSLNRQEEKLLAARTQHASDYKATAPFTLLSIQLGIVICLLIGFILVTADLKTKQKLQAETAQRNRELKEQRDFIQSIFENTVDVMIIFDQNANIVAFNKRARELYDPHGNAIGKKVLEAFPQVRGTHFLEGITAALTGKHYHTPAQESVVYQGTYYESFYVPLFSGDKNVVGVMAIHHDVSEVMKMNFEIRAMNNELQKSNHELEQFAYVTSHDLQEPLRKILTFSDIANRNIENKEIVARNLGKLSASANRMSALIRDILNYSRLTNASEENDEVDLNEVVDQVLQDFELTIEEKEAIIESTRLPKVLGSRQQLTQVFGNIISNALKFCTTAPCIKITCRHVDGNFEISISDNGIGFEQSYAEQIFRVFQRLHHRSEFAGTGIGLALCKKIVENHGGSIKAASTPGKGTTITITLPDPVKKILTADVEKIQQSTKSAPFSIAMSAKT